MDGIYGGGICGCSETRSISSISVEAKHPVLIYHDIVSHKGPSKTCHRERELPQLSQRPHVEDQSGLASSPEDNIFVSRFEWSD